MAWEQRKGKLYYYWKVRVGGKVVSRYVGRNAGGEFIAQEIAEARQAKESLAREKKEWQELEHQLDQLRRQTEAELIAAGLHRPNWGRWRKKRKPSC